MSERFADLIHGNIRQENMGEGYMIQEPRFYSTLYPLLLCFSSTLYFLITYVQVKQCMMNDSERTILVSNECDNYFSLFFSNLLFLNRMIISLLF